MTLLPKNNTTDLQSEKTGGNQLFPVFLKLDNLHTVLVGGGNVGLEKLTALLQNSPDAAVTIISKTFLPEIHTLAAEYAQLNIIQKPFSDTDLTVPILLLQLPTIAN
jgi:siroheme synthase (precorrin-2 oxidase/ferrochelatase)